jgi:hypothetical protein
MVEMNRLRILSVAAQSGVNSDRPATSLDTGIIPKAVSNSNSPPVPCAGGRAQPAACGNSAHVPTPSYAKSCGQCGIYALIDYYVTSRTDGTQQVVGSLSAVLRPCVQPDQLPTSLELLPKIEGDGSAVHGVERQIPCSCRSTLNEPESILEAANVAEERRVDVVHLSWTRAPTPRLPSRFLRCRECTRWTRRRRA